MKVLWMMCTLGACQNKSVGIQTSEPPAVQSSSDDVKAVKVAVFPEIQQYLDTWNTEGKPDSITDERAQAFSDLADWIVEQRDAGKPIQLMFVCTHNSRRSHISQLWAQAAAAYLNVDNVQTFSGGTEATAFNPRSVRALRSHGFVIEDTESGTESNPVYRTQIGEGLPSLESFSKKYSHEVNPNSDFAAVMVCTKADKECPFVQGASTRVAIPYIDPKLSDGTPEEAATYLAKSEEIGREMLYLFSLVASR